MSGPTLPTAPGARGVPDHAIRERIVLAATDHFRRSGYEKTTVSELASAIGFSKAYIYKFFESKQAIGEAICTNCMQGIIELVEKNGAEAASSSDAIRRMFRSLLEGTSTLFSQDRKLYDIAAVAARDRWHVVIAYESYLHTLLVRILTAGRKAGEFERKTPLDETAAAIMLVMRPFGNPLLLQYGLDDAPEAASHVTGLVLRSLAP
jgi:AcrR family transcriptional regulator